MEPITWILAGFLAILVSAGAWLGHTWLSRTPKKEPFHASLTASALSDRIDALEQKVRESKSDSQTADQTSNEALAEVKRVRDQLNGKIGAQTKQIAEIDSQFQQLITSLYAPQQQAASPQPQQGLEGQAALFDPNTMMR